MLAHIQLLLLHKFRSWEHRELERHNTCRIGLLKHSWKPSLWFCRLDIVYLISFDIILSFQRLISLYDFISLLFFFRKVLCHHFFLIFLNFWVKCRGPEGSEVELTIQSGSEIKHLSLTYVHRLNILCSNELSASRL